MSPWIFVGAFLVVVVASTTQASIGFGANLISMPTIALLEPDLVPASALIAIIAQNVLTLWRDRDGLEVRPVSVALVGRVCGTVIAIPVLRQLGAEGIQLIVAVTVLGLVALTASPLAPRRTTATMAGAGTISGFFAATAGIGGPPVALLFQKDPGPSIRGSMSGFFTVGTTITVIGLAIAGRLGWWELGWGLALVPAAIAGYLLSGPLLPVVDRGATRPAILALSSVAAVALLVRVAI